MLVQTHKDGGITCFVLKETVYKGVDWEQIPIDQIPRYNKRPALVGYPKL